MVTGEFKGWSKKYALSDVIVVGSGPAGLMAARDLARMDLKILLVEADMSIGGRLWADNFLISTSSLMPQIKEILDELKIPYKKGKTGVAVTAGPNFSSKLISAVCDAGVRILTAAEFKSLIYTDEKIEGLVINWTPNLSSKNKAIMPVSVPLKSQAILDATGRDACVYKSLVEKGIVKPTRMKDVNIHTSEDLLLEKTGNIYPGLAVAGMAAAAIYGIPEEGLTLCSMLLSGRKVADEIVISLSENFLIWRKS